MNNCIDCKYYIEDMSSKSMGHCHYEYIVRGRNAEWVLVMGNKPGCSHYVEKVEKKEDKPTKKRVYRRKK